MISYIDTSSRLAFVNMDGNESGSYTATVNCWAVIYGYHTSISSFGGAVYIGDDVIATTVNTNANTGPIFPLKKGQILKWSKYTSGSLIVYPMA